MDSEAEHSNPPTLTRSWSRRLQHLRTGGFDCFPDTEAREFCHLPMAPSRVPHLHLQQDSNGPECKKEGNFIVHR